MKAKWVKLFEVDFESNGANTTPDAQTIEDGDTVTEPDEPVRPGFRFTGWYTEIACENLYNFADPVTATFTLYAGWAARADYVFTLNDGGDGYIVSAGAEAAGVMIIPAEHSGKPVR